jgi:tetratricopeptide (TPR) repeat protein
MNSERLVISLLGPPLVTLGGKPLQIKRRKVRFLLYYLACQECAVSRTSLCDVFWPDQSESESRKNLREALSNLHSALNSDDYLSIQGEYISLYENKIQVDVRDFEKTISLLRKNLEISPNSNFSDDVYLKVREGIDLWRTPGFISGSTLTDSEVYQKWASDKNVSLEYWRQMMLEWIADHCISSGNLNEALQWLSLALLSDKHNSELNFLVLNCLRDLEAWSELLHFCDMLESIYQENGQSTLPQLLQHSIGRSRELANNPIPESHIVWNDEGKHSVHFVDGNQRKTILNNRLQTGGMVLLRGEIGSGKSRLLKEVIGSMEVVPRLIFFRSNPGDELIPYSALVEGLKNVVTKEEWKELDPIYAKALFPLFPYIDKIRDDIRDEDIAFSVGLNRLIPDAFFYLFSLIARKRKVLYVLDNAQWCDAETLRAFSFGHEKGGAQDIGTVVFTTCLEVKNTFLENLFNRDQNFHHKSVIDLVPLNEAEIYEIVFIFWERNFLKRNANG